MKLELINGELTQNIRNSALDKVFSDVFKCIDYHYGWGMKKSFFTENIILKIHSLAILHITNKLKTYEF